MKLSYDPRYNIAYIRLHEKAAQDGQVSTVQVGAELNIDVAPDGTVYGIELLNANRQLRGEDQGNLIIVNEERGERREVLLP